MKPNGGGDATGNIAALIEKDFGSFAKFKVCKNGWGRQRGETEREREGERYWRMQDINLNRNHSLKSVLVYLEVDGFGYAKMVIN